MFLCVFFFLTIHAELVWDGLWASKGAAETKQGSDAAHGSVLWSIDGNVIDVINTLDFS